MDEQVLERDIDAIIQIGYGGGGPLSDTYEGYADASVKDYGEAALMPILQYLKMHAADASLHLQHPKARFYAISQILTAYLDNYPETTLAQFRSLISDDDMRSLVISGAADSNQATRTQIVEAAIPLIPMMSEADTEEFFDNVILAPLEDRDRLLHAVAQVLPVSADAVRRQLLIYGVDEADLRKK